MAAHTSELGVSLQLTNIYISKMVHVRDTHAFFFVGGTWRQFSLTEFVLKCYSVHPKNTDAIDCLTVCVDVFFHIIPINYSLVVLVRGAKQAELLTA